MAVPSLLAHGYPEHGTGEVDDDGNALEGVRDLFENWSRQSSKFNEATFEDDWNSIAPARTNGNSITWHSLFAAARKAGWRPNADAGDDCPDDGTDAGFGCRFVAFADGSIMFSDGRWFSWTGIFWKPSERDVRVKLAAFALSHVCRAKEVHAEAMKTAMAAMLADNAASARAIRTKANAALREAKGVLEQPRQDRVLKMAQTACYADEALLDADIYLTCAPNGIIDLTTGELLPPDPARYMTRVVACDYDPRAENELLMKTLAEILPDIDTLEYVQQWAGLQLSGDVSYLSPHEYLDGGL